MSQPEHEMQPPPPPAYGPPPAYHQVQPEEPARLGPFERLVGTLFSPVETFKDINRKPTWLTPMLIAVVAGIVFALFLNWKLDAGWTEFMRKTLTDQAQQGGGQPPTADQIQKATFFLKIYFVVVSIIAPPVLYLIVAGVFALGMLLLGAQTTFKKILSVVAWSFCSVGIISLLVTVASLMLRDAESLKTLNPQNLDTISASNLGALLSSDSAKWVKAIAGSLDVFSFWMMALLTVGLAAIAGKRSIKASSTGAMVFGLWIAYVVVKTALTAIFA
jgi:hypothetical protein